MARSPRTIQTYESLIEQLTKEYGSSYHTSSFHDDRATFNLPPLPKPLTKGQQAQFSQPVGGKSPLKVTPGEAAKLSDTNTQVPLKASSTIQSAAYWPDRKYLVVSFKSGGSYSYQGVPVETILAWQDASSAGSFFYYNIRTSFRYQKL